MKFEVKSALANIGWPLAAGVLMVVMSILGTPASARQPGSVVVWGYNEHGQVSAAPSGNDFIRIAGGVGHCLGLRTSGFVEAWGYNVQGQCNVTPPNSGFTEIAAAQQHSLGLKGGAVVPWGSNPWSIPPPNSGFIAVSSFNLHNLALRTDSSVAAWGFNEDGQCTVPFPNADFEAVAAGGYHSLALKEGGAIVTWGRNNAGQCVVELPNIGYVAIAAGDEHSLGLRADGSIEAWGRDDAGQCQVPEPNNGFVAIAAGHSHSLGLRANGRIEAWGSNEAGQCIVTPPNSGFVAIAAGWYHSMGIRTAATAIVPTSTTLAPGVVVSGTPASLNTSNDAYYVLGPGVTFSTAQSPVVLTATCTLPSNSPSALSSVVESRAHQGNMRQTIEVFNFSTNSFNLLNQQTLPTSVPDTVVASALNTNHIGVGNEVRLRISYKAIGPMFTYPWRVSIDETTLRFTP